LSKPHEKDVKIACLSNRATCYAQHHNYQKVIADSTKVLEMEPTHVKALIRRGLAYEATEKYKLGLEDMRQAQAYSGGSPVISQVINFFSLFSLLLSIIPTNHSFKGYCSSHRKRSLFIKKSPKFYK
jgi:tetratricopeptide (TPR) repeat protein